MCPHLALSRLRQHAHQVGGKRDDTLATRADQSQCTVPDEKNRHRNPAAQRTYQNIILGLSAHYDKFLGCAAWACQIPCFIAGSISLPKSSSERYALAGSIPGNWHTTSSRICSTRCLTKSTGPKSAARLSRSGSGRMKVLRRAISRKARPDKSSP